METGLVKDNLNAVNPAFPFRILGVFLACLFLAFPVYTAEPGEENVAFSIRFFDRRIYHVSSQPVYVQITVANNGPSTYRFKLADERAFSVDFDVRTTGNRGLEPAGNLVRKRTQSGRVFFREIAVESGESFSFIEDLRDYADLHEPGSFIVQGRIYPELYRTDGGAENAALLSNRLSLAIRPPVIPGPEGIPLAMDEETGAVLVREKLAPDAVVEYFINARQRSQWEKYFLYLDVDSLISRDPARNRQYLAESEEGRRRMADAYREEVQAGGDDIALSPSEYTLERTEYGALEGTVTVLEKFRMVNYTERKRYTYYLRRRDDVWTIVDYSVVNLGTE
ncbi:MAG: hypothetical protein LBL44_07180 [Treponema sp.]|jgi:hypothetical protein|nr:hypothetical protein [Treponema sp.]